jgi:uncharacterized RDD family membrane protein YckC
VGQVDNLSYSFDGDPRQVDNLSYVIGWIVAEAKLLPANALEKNAPKAVPPLAGFWFRLGALALDIFLLRLALQMTYPALRPLYLSIGSALVVVGPLVAFVYLVLAEGPVGKGMTLGKAIVGIRTTDLSGERASISAAAIRAALLLVLALPFLGSEMGARCAANGDRNGLFLASGMLRGMAMAFIIANVFLVVLHPLKQTAHDLLAGTLVVREAGAHHLSVFLEQIEGQLAPLQRRAIQVAAVAFVALSAINMFGEYRQVFSAEGENYLRFMRLFDKEFRYGPFRPNYRGTMLGWVEGRLASDGMTSESWTRRLNVLAKSGDRPTSQSHTVVLEFRSSGAVKADDLGDSQALAGLGSRAVAWIEREIRDDVYPLDRKMRSRSEIIFQPRCVTLLFVENVNLLLYNHESVIDAEIRPLAIPKSLYEEDVAAREAASAAHASNEATTQTAATDRPTTGGR